MALTVADPVSELTDLLGRFNELRDEGWTITRTPVSMSAARESESLSALLQDADRVIGDGVRLRAEGRFQDMSLTILDPRADHPTVTDQSAGDPDENFEHPYQADAVDAWAGDAAAAMRLPGRWSVRIDCDVRYLAQRIDHRFDWKLLSTTGELEQIVHTPPWRLGPLLTSERPIAYLVGDAHPGDLLVAGGTVFTSIDSEAISIACESASGYVPDQSWHAPTLGESLPPSAIAPVERRGPSFTVVEEALWRSAAAAAWIGMSTNAVLLDPKHLAVEVFGLQRTEHVISDEGIAIGLRGAKVTLELYSWATGPDAVDQALATHQVASLYREDPPWLQPDDVFKAARAVFNTLRRDAVSEVFESRRETRALAVEIAHKAVDATATMTRSTAERCVATFLAIGGVIVAQSAEALTEEVALKLRVLLAVILVALAAWNVFIEWPPVAGPLKALKSDIRQIGDFLTEDETSDVLNLKAVISAGRRLTVARFAIPAAYVVGAAVSLLAR